MNVVSDLIANIDLDGSVANLAPALVRGLNSMRSPAEAEFTEAALNDPAPWLDARLDYIKQHPGFWRNLEPIPEGLRVVALMRTFGYTLNVLSKGPKRAANAWTEKLQWSLEHIPDALVTVTLHKGFTYGRVLFDDFPGHITDWLEHRPRGIVLMLNQPWNRSFTHPNVVRVGRIADGSWDETLPALKEALARGTEAR